LSKYSEALIPYLFLVSVNTHQQVDFGVAKFGGLLLNCHKKVSYVFKFYPVEFD